MICIIDYGMGNLNSILNMLKKIRVKAVISSNATEIKKAEKLILPGVGAFDNGMKNLHEKGLVPILEEKVINQKTPILGICLGMHLFMNKSDEGERPGLGWLDADVVKFKPEYDGQKFRVPHMGWNTIEKVKEHPLLSNMPEETRFYFVHSYYVQCRENRDILCKTLYGKPFTSGTAKENIFGLQFHPEKSHKFGMQILTNYSSMPGTTPA